MSWMSHVARPQPSFARRPVPLRLRRTAVAVAALLTAAQGGIAMQKLDRPISEPRDALMASPAEVQRMNEWVRAAFLGAPPGAHVRITVRRQDHSVLQYGRSCIDTPLRIGRKAYKHGLGTHAVSEIAVELPPGAKRFEAEVGVDNNADTGGVRGSVVFSAEVAGREAFATGVCKGGDAPTPVRVDLPAGARELVLRVGDGGDGVACDQADWADARLVLADGRTVYLDEGQLDLLVAASAPPFSFVYGGTPSAELLPKWERTVSTEAAADRTIHRVRWTDPASRLVVTATVSVFKRYPAADWVLTFENAGAQDTPILEDIQAADVGLRCGYANRALTIHQLHGDDCSERSFSPVRTDLEGGKSYRMAPTGGRPSSTTAFPWWNLEYAGQGCIAAIGWTGQWAASFDRAPTGPGRMRAGMERTHLLLHPGEKIRTPRILLMPWEGDRRAAHIRFRRLVMFHYAPKLDGKPAWIPLNLQTFDRYNGRPEWATEKGQLDYVRAAARIGLDSAWLDAAWFPGGFPNGVGNWYARPQEFPNGLRPVTDLAHRLGLRFVLWFEPERVGQGTQIARERPDFVFGGEQGGLFKLQDPAARAWLTDMLSKRIEEWNLDVYRNDFNIDPLPFWRANDTPDRQGMTEIRYVEGLYEMWDELLKRHPGLLIDNCASGGRRLDLEMTMRSVPLWRSDTGCFPGHPEWNQMQSMQLAQYLPLFSISCWETDVYEARSSGTMGMNCEFPYLDPAFSLARARAVIADVERTRGFWYGDFYPLTGTGIEPEQFVAYQLHRPDTGAGVVYGFRRRSCRTVGLIVGLNGLRTSATYRVDTFDAAGRLASTVEARGKELLAGLTLRVPQPGASVVVRYQPIR